MKNFKKYGLKIILLLLISSLSFFIIELGLRDFQISLVYKFARSYKKIMLVSILLIFLIIFLLALLSNNIWLSSIFFLYGSILLAFSTHLKIRFRQEPVFPSDLELLRSMNDLIQMVEFKFLILLLLVTFSSLLLTVYLTKNLPLKLTAKHKKFYILRLLLSLCVILILFSVSNVHASGNRFNKVIQSAGFKEFAWDPLATYQQNGFVLSFISNFSGQVMSEPENYSRETVISILEKYEEATDQRNRNRKNDNFQGISVIFILSESLADPRIINGVDLEHSPIPYIQDPSDKYLSGKMIVPTYGGGTPNTEYEILTGLAIQDLETNMNIPYQKFLSSYRSFPSFVSEYKDADNTKAISIHSFNSKMYKRRDVYRVLGFDEIYFEDDMEFNYSVDNNKFISDAASYEETLKYLKSEIEDVFIHLITMQNHASYEDKYEAYEQEAYVEGNPKLSEEITFFTQGIKLTDEATKSFIEEVSKLDRDVAVVLYGDHHPGLYNSLDEQNDTFSKATTDFFIYTNFGEQSIELDAPVSSTNIINHVYNASDVKVNELHQLIWELREEIPAARHQKYLTKNGNIKDWEDLNLKEKELLDDYRMIQYDLIEGKAYSHSYLNP